MSRNMALIRAEAHLLQVLGRVNLVEGQFRENITIDGRSQEERDMVIRLREVLREVTNPMACIPRGVWATTR